MKKGTTVFKMKYEDIIERIKDLDKSKILITDFVRKDFSQIALKYNNVRLFNLTRPQLNKLEKLDYEVERVRY